MISLTDNYKYSNAKTWSELLEISEKAKIGIENEIDELITFIKNELIGKVLKDKENIAHNKLQIDYLDKRIVSLEDTKKAIKTAYTSIHYLFKPAIFFSKTKLEKFKEKKENNIRTLEAAIKENEERIEKIKNNVRQLNIEREKFLIEIKRLKNFL